MPPSTRRWVAAKSFLTVSRPPPAPLENFISFAAPRACPRSKTSAAPPALQQLQQKNLPSTSRWVAAKSFLTVSRPPPAPLETFKSFAAPRACSGSCKSLTSNLRRASIHAPLGGRKVFSYGFETAACPPRKLHILRSASSLPPLQNLRSASSPSTAPTKKPSIHEPLGGRKVLSYGFETAACPPRKLQILRSASSLPWLQNLRSASSPSTPPCSVQWPFQLIVAFLGVTASWQHPVALPASFRWLSTQRLAPALCKSL